MVFSNLLIRAQNKLLAGTIRNSPSLARLDELPANNSPQSNRTTNPAVAAFRNLLELTITAPFSNFSYIFCFLFQ
jgi:hypothetical protein